MAKNAVRKMSFPAQRASPMTAQGNALGSCGKFALSPNGAALRAETEISGARFHRAEHVRNVLHVRKFRVAPLGNAVKDFSRQNTGFMKGIAGRTDPAFEPRMWRQVVATGVSPWLGKHR